MSTDQEQNAMLGSLTECVSPFSLTAQRKSLLHDTLIASINEAPAPPGSFTLRSYEQGDWQELLPGVKRKTLYQHSNRMVSLYELAPNAILPPHDHAEREECWVLWGEISSECGHVVKAGDVHIAEAGSPHPAIHSQTGALLWISEVSAN